MKAPALSHWDIRNDNMLIRPGGQAVTFGWGMARMAGPAWADEFCLALEWAGSGRIDGYLTEVSTCHGAAQADRTLALPWAPPGGAVARCRYE